MQLPITSAAVILVVWVAKMKSLKQLGLRLFLFCSVLGLCTLSVAANDKVEIIQGKGRLNKEGSTTGRSARNGDRLDQDGNKKLSMDELLAEHQRQIKAFTQADKNKDGELSAAERKVFKKSIKLKACGR